jgi:dihydroorotate dehydrogenase (NAD+) catalytic subunit
VETVKAVAELKPDLIEVNISCPNVEDEFGKPFEFDLDTVKDLTSRAKKACGKVPLAIKISRNVPDVAQLAKAIEAAGADAITAINTVGPGMVIDIETSKPVLANKVGGISGPAIRPLAIKAVHDIYSAVKIPIIGTGGIMNGRDAIEMLQAGAALVSIGSATYQGLNIFEAINKEIVDWCSQHNIKNISELTGMAHKEN